MGIAICRAFSTDLAKSSSMESVSRHSNSRAPSTHLFRQRTDLSPTSVINQVRVYPTPEVLEVILRFGSKIGQADLRVLSVSSMHNQSQAELQTHE